MVNDPNRSASKRGCKQVWRYELTGPDCLVSAPDGAAVVHVGFQNRAPYALCVWLLVDPLADNALLPFITTATGEDIPQDAEHAGTAQSPEGLVWHVWVPA